MPAVFNLRPGEPGLSVYWSRHAISPAVIYMYIGLLWMQGTTDYQKPHKFTLYRLKWKTLKEEEFISHATHKPKNRQLPFPIGDPGNRSHSEIIYAKGHGWTENMIRNRCLKHARKEAYSDPKKAIAQYTRQPFI